ncbi:hypothetical protein ACFQMG_27055, partial [Kitasatospora paranensis]
MLRPLLAVPLLTAAAGLWLGRSALGQWRDLRVARTYELVFEQRPLLIRSVAAGLCLAGSAALAGVLVLGPGGPGGGHPADGGGTD